MNSFVEAKQWHDTVSKEKERRGKVGKKRRNARKKKAELKKLSGRNKATANVRYDKAVVNPVDPKKVVGSASYVPPKQVPLAKEHQPYVKSATPIVITNDDDGKPVVRYRRRTYTGKGGVPCEELIPEFAYTYSKPGAVSIDRVNGSGTDWRTTKSVGKVYFHNERRHKKPKVVVCEKSYQDKVLEKEQKVLASIERQKVISEKRAERLERKERGIHDPKVNAKLQRRWAKKNMKAKGK